MKPLLTFLFLYFSFINLCFSKLEVTSEQAEAYRRKGIALKNEGNFWEAKKNYEYALEGFINLKDSSGIGNVYNNLGTVFFYLTDFEKCMEYYNKGLEIFESVNDHFGIGKIELGVANYYYYQDKDFSLSLNHYQKSLSIFEEAKHTRLMLVSYNNIGNVLSEEHPNNQILDKDSAKFYYQKALYLAKSIQDTLQVGGVLMNMGRLHSSSDFDSSFNFYSKALAIFRTVGNQYKEASVLLNLGNLYSIFDKRSEAINLYIKSLSIAQRIKSHDLIHSVSRRLYEKYEEQGSKDSLSKYYRMYFIFNDSIYGTNKIKEIEQLKAVHESKRKDYEMLQQKATLNLRTSERNGIMISLIVALSLTTILILIYKQRQHAVLSLKAKEKEIFNMKVASLVREQEIKILDAKTQGEEVERKRISRDLHDRVGSMISAIKIQLPESNELMSKLIDETAYEVRQISHNLQSDVLVKFGLIAAIDNLVHDINCSNKVMMSFIHTDLERGLDERVEINLYRVIQELISNAIRHGQSSEININLSRLEDAILMIFEDNGLGFDAQILELNSGMGFRNIESRITLISGKFFVDSSKGKGTTVTLEIPI